MLTGYEKFRLFHFENPDVFDLFEKFARQAKASGRGRFGAFMIGNRIRWYTQVEVVGDDYKINNNYLPYWARLLMLKYEDDFAGFFELRSMLVEISDKTLLEECG